MYELLLSKTYGSMGFDKKAKLNCDEEPPEVDRISSTEPEYALPSNLLSNTPKTSRSVLDYNGSELAS